MPFDYKPETDSFKISNSPVAGPDVYCNEIFGTMASQVDKSPLTSSLFLLDGASTSAPLKYTYDETGVVLQGNLTIKDAETGVVKTVTEGDTFFIHRGSTITFSTTSYGLSFQAASRKPNTSESDSAGEETPSGRTNVVVRSSL
ncbi:uncharacterized protein K460DRAFT_413166 [Cucurbitaria berberidis CBS 394.84]|uniref:(S)-ureidoglycine aminohydrolase cupin domain-containing protein n=1 Tax=Cucurbitaria berberidis CBS 394.84 TaxID=1168544 RepID=A0A9P4GTQ1_9PLEO|nr:uncharacterized protein K460DRAFT_413166 [Cucurbitaria berberidis CBS 394.84]KAF1851627.1 hypothetical protein K460DRAFT_413166 [Cucurbitaria berberidis CBS 394.84]